ncbi:MAG: YceD family protein [Woeseiaceae bacterium]|nr:YceD family protein [Woeseiaceae bacterium]
MGNPLRERRTATDWAAGGQVIEIAEKVGDFEQLGSIVGADLAALDTDRMPADWRNAAVTGRIEFGFVDAQQLLPRAILSVATTVDAVCQRCLEAFRLPLEAEAELLLLELEQSVEGYDEYEVWELDDKLLMPLEVVEEMLVMAMPFSAMHVDSASCKVLEPAAEPVEEKTTTPFAALREQMAQDK